MPDVTPRLRLVAAVLFALLLLSVVLPYASASALPQSPSDGDSDCVLLNLPILQTWNLVPSQIPDDIETNCCTSSWWTGSIVSCKFDDFGVNRIDRLNLSGLGLIGAVPVALNKLTALTFLDISANPSVMGGLLIMAGMPNLNTLIASGDSGLVGNVPTFGTSLQVCRLDGTNLCGNPGQCLGSDPPLKSCGSTSNPMDPGSFYPLKPSLTLWLVTGCAGFFLLVILCMCYFCGKRGAVAARQLAIAAAAKAPKQPADDAYHRNPPSETEMTLITLSRTGLPPRIDSLPDRRRTLSPSGGGTADRNHHDPVAARTPFLLANAPRGSETFPVRRGHAKTRPDELALAKDDAVLLLRVFADGWAEGVSRRAGGPAVFPLACLGGGVPVVLAERVRSAGDGFAGAPTWPPAVSEQEVVVSRGTVPVPMEEGRQEGSSSSVLPLLGSGKKGVGQPM